MDARDWDRRWEERALESHREPGAVVVSALDGLRPGRALDLGCGAGRHAIWLAGRGWDVAAVDFSSEALRQGRERAEAHGVAIDWVEADIVSYEPRAGAFDLVLLAYIHLPAGERRTLLAHAAAAVKPGGTFLLVGHDSTNLGTGAPGPSSPVVLYTPDDIVPDLDGLRVVRAEQVRRPVELEDGTTVHAVDALVLATRARDAADAGEQVAVDLPDGIEHIG